MSATWSYVDASGSQVGPVPEQELASMLQRSEIPMETPLWRDGMDSWKQALEVEEFAAIKPTVPPPGDYDEVWYYLSRARERKGPVSGMALARMVSTKDLDGTAMVWSPQFGETWKPMAQVPELKAMIRRVQSATAERPDGDAEAGAHRYVTPNGEELVFDATAKKWVSNKADGAGAAALGAENGKAAKAPSAADEEARAAKSRKRERSRNSKKRKSREAAMRKILYVTGLPGDATERELSDLFSKYGVFQLDLETGDPRIKLYRDEEGKPKGDGTIAYLREESVDLAIEMVDGDTLRGHKLHVEPARFEPKPAAEGAGKEGAAPPKRRRKPLSHLAKIRAKAQEQLLSWNEGVGDDSPKIVVVLHMFEPAEFKDPKFEAQLKTDIDEGFGVYGEIEKVTVFERNPLGVLIIKFKDAYAAEQCVRHTDGRFYAGRRLQCKYWDGTDYSVPESEEEAEVKDEKDLERIHSFGDWLEGASSDSSDDVAVKWE